MFVKRVITLPEGMDFVIGHLLKADDVDHITNMQVLLDKARKQAESIVFQAEQNADDILENAKKISALEVKKNVEAAQKEIWQRANTLLESLDEEKKRLQQEVEEYATQVVTSAMKKLFGDLDEENRLRLLIRHISIAQNTKSNGTIYAHPDQIETLQSILSHEQCKRWHLEPDINIEIDSVILESSGGEFLSSIDGLLEPFC